MLKEDGLKVVTRYYLKRLVEPVSEATWIALEEELEDALTARRRDSVRRHILCSEPWLKKEEIERRMA